MCSEFSSQGRKHKGQTEFVVVLGLIIVGVVVAVLAIQPNILTVPTAPADIRIEQEFVVDGVKVVTDSATATTVGTVMEHGGYLTPEELGGGEAVPFYVFLDSGVPLVQSCDDISRVPSKDLVTEHLEIGIEKLIRENIELIRITSDKDVDIDLSQLRVDANILSDKVQISVFLPTTVEGYPIQQPFPVTEFSTHLGEIRDFQEDLAIELRNNRHFEVFTKNSIMFARGLPHDGVCTDCGTCLDYSGGEIDTGLEQVAESSHKVAWWTGMVNQDGWDVPKQYAIPSVNGKVYDNLREIRTDLPDGFEISGSDDIELDNSDVALSVPGLAPPLETTDVCIKTYHNAFGLTYPIIFSVFDSEPGVGKWYRFAVLVNLDAGPSGAIDGEAIVNSIIDGYDQSLFDSGLDENGFGAALDQAAIDQGATLDPADRQGFLDLLGSETTSLQDVITQNVDVVSSTETLDMFPGNCVFG